METTDRNHPEAAFRSWLIDQLSTQLQRPAAEISPSVPFVEYGIDSVASLSLYGEIEEEFGLCLEPTVAWEYPDVDSLARHLAEESARLQGATPGRPA
jgi:acyl carrier protein